ncbi:glutamic acid-rich protein-like [Neltuma alba]|uniref:glutamic acid-rich protein-like n=1 Tax=Neltuma alba TaxID=207710 RepID=UPI0010A352FE|nr:glutamic acid-rich protein-like [Prosopis alba]
MGTLLCPTGSASVSEKVLKIMACIENKWQNFDWASFVLDELSKEIKRYNKSSKEGQTQGAKVVEGYTSCKDSLCREVNRKTKTPHWDDKAMKSRIDAEKESRHGIFYNPPSTKVNESTQLGNNKSFHHPEFWVNFNNTLKNEMAKIQNFVCDELVKLENKILNWGSNEEVNYEQSDENKKDEHEEGKEHYTEEDEDEQSQHDEVMIVEGEEKHQSGEKSHDDEQQEEEEEDEDKNDNVRENKATKKDTKGE